MVTSIKPSSLVTVSPALKSTELPSAFSPSVAARGAVELAVLVMTALSVESLTSGSVVPVVPLVALSDA